MKLVPLALRLSLDHECTVLGQESLESLEAWP
jgi:hypothetical protein